MIGATQSVLGGIGNTPLVELRNVVPPGSARVVAKLEWAHNDRVRIVAVEPAESATLRVAARLGPGATVATLIVDSGVRYLSSDLFTASD